MHALLTLNRSHDSQYCTWLANPMLVITQLYKEIPKTPSPLVNGYVFKRIIWHSDNKALGTQAHAKIERQKGKTKEHQENAVMHNCCQSLKGVL